ncbi:MAG: DUF1343 domain-containing protein [Bacteroidota bacterium]
MRVLYSLLALFLCLSLNAQNAGIEIKQVSDSDVTVGAALFDEYLPLIKNKNIAVVANHSSFVKNEHLVDVLLKKGVLIRKIFTPEHGFRGIADAGQAVKSSVDSKTKLPVVSLYDDKKKPDPSDLKGIDVVLFDIQDVGARFYTYISTMTYMMEACAENNIQIIILDRPNPNGFYVDGPVLKKGFESFIGMHPVPIVYGMTVGEYAQMINGEGWLKNGVKCNLKIITVKGYSHKYKYVLPINPSPNLRSMASIYMYPTMCLFEGTVVSVGRGTDKPFEVYGHPNFKNTNYSFTPKSTKGAGSPLYDGQKCFGYDVTDFGLMYVADSKAIYLEWLIESYNELNMGAAFFNNYFNNLAGTDDLKKQIIIGKTAQKIRDSWKSDLTKFKEIRKKYLLYPDFE